MAKSIIPEADRLIGEIKARIEADVAKSPDAAASRLHVAGEIRLIDSVRHIILVDMVGRLGG